MNPKWGMAGIMARLSDAQLEAKIEEAVEELWPIPWNRHSRWIAWVWLSEKARRGRAKSVGSTVLRRARLGRK